MITHTSDKILWIFLHLRKTGGTTFGAHAAQHLDFDDNFVSLSHWGRAHRKQHHRPDLPKRSEAEREPIRLISGQQAYYGVHHLVPGKTPRYITFVRDPAARLVSLHNYLRSTDRIDQSFESWLENQANPNRRNPMTKFYAGCLFKGQQIDDDPPENLRAAKAMLDRCWLVTATRHLNEDLGPLFSAMGLPPKWNNMRVAENPTSQDADDSPHLPANNEHLQRHVKLNPDLQSRIDTEHPADRELYTYALQLRQKGLANLSQASALEL